MSNQSSFKTILNTILVTVLVIIVFVAAAARWAGPQFSLFLAQWGGEDIVSDRQVEKVVVSEETAIIDVVESARPSVVSILVGKVSWNPFTGPEKVEGGIGTGFIVDEEGLILTNRHVVSDENAKYTVVLDNDEEYEVQEIHRDPFNDLAILKIDAGNLAPLPLGDSDALKVGQKVVAIGNALGEFPNAVTAGVVSGIGRGITASSSPFGGSSEVLENVIQTDAALNPGNSGGPLLNLSAEVIGINVAMSQGAENIGFAVPINSIKSTLENFRTHGRIVRPFLGIRYAIITKELAIRNELPEGAYIQEVVNDSPAEDAGLKSSDIITKFAGENLTEETTLAEVIRGKEVGDRVSMEVYRNGETLNLQATLGETPSE